MKLSHLFGVLVCLLALGACTSPAGTKAQAAGECNGGEASNCMEEEPEGETESPEGEGESEGGEGETEPPESDPEPPEVEPPGEGECDAIDCEEPEPIPEPCENDGPDCMPPECAEMSEDECSVPGDGCEPVYGPSCEACLDYVYQGCSPRGIQYTDPCLLLDGDSCTNDHDLCEPHYGASCPGCRDYSYLGCTTQGQAPCETFDEGMCDANGEECEGVRFTDCFETCNADGECFPCEGEFVCTYR